MMRPFLIRPDGRRAVVFGGGPVALRKCRYLEGYRIRAVAAEVLPEIYGLAEEVVIADLDAGSVASELEGAFIAVAATGDKELNAMIRDTAAGRGVLVNSAHGGGDLLIPSVLERDDYTVAVSSRGSAPAFPPYLIEVLDGFLDPGYDAMMSLLKELRPAVMSQVPAQHDRAELLAGILRDPGIWELLRAGGRAEALAAAMARGGLR
jgi:precorrin-2 dehydrogenase/sirohydrochlorin ferrochelatase